MNEYTLSLTIAPLAGIALGLAFAAQQGWFGPLNPYGPFA